MFSFSLFFGFWVFSWFCSDMYLLTWLHCVHGCVLNWFVGRIGGIFFLPMHVFDDFGFRTTISAGFRAVTMVDGLPRVFTFFPDRRQIGAIHDQYYFVIGVCFRRTLWYEPAYLNIILSEQGSISELAACTRRGSRRCVEERSGATKVGFHGSAFCSDFRIFGFSGFCLHVDPRSSGIVLYTRAVFLNAEMTVQDLYYGQILMNFHWICGLGFPIIHGLGLYAILFVFVFFFCSFVFVFVFVLVVCCCLFVLGFCCFCFSFVFCFLCLCVCSFLILLFVVFVLLLFLFVVFVLLIYYVFVIVFEFCLFVYSFFFIVVL